MLNKKIKLALIFLVLIITFLLVYSPHFNYKYPLHADEWHHVENAERILDGNYDYKAPNYEIGYDFIIAGFFAILKIFKINTIMAYSFFPAIFAIIASLLLFIFVRKIAGFNVALLSMIFFASLPSNINILGLWFAIPLTMAIPFIFLFLNLFVNGFESKKRFYYCIPILLLLFLIHPPSALIVISISFIYCFFARDIKKNWLPLILIFLVPLLALILSSFTVPIKLTFYNLVFKHGYTVYEPSLELYSLKLAVGKNVLAINRYFVPLIYGIIPFLLALVGIYFVYKEEKLKKVNIFLILFLFTMILIFMFNNFKFTILAQNQRLLYYCMLSLIPLSAIGLERILFFVKERTAKRVGVVLIILLLVSGLGLTFYNYPKLWDGVRPYYLVNENSYEAMTSLKSIANNKIVLAPVEVGEVVYPISKNNAVTGLYFIGNEQIRKEIVVFFLETTDCEMKEFIAKRYAADFVISDKEVNCSFLELASDKYIIYRVT